LREIFFDENSIDNGLRQAHKKIVTEGFDSYIILAVDHGGEHIAKRLKKYWNYKDIVSCHFKNGDIHISDESKIRGGKVYFPWSDYPIRTYSKGIVRKISCEDCKKDFRCGNPNIDKNSLSDFFKNQEHSSAKVYLVEDKGEICSIVQFYEKHLDSYKGLFLDIIATAEIKKGNKYASTLLKLISFYMFYHEFSFIYGYVFDNKELIEVYKKRGFEVIGSIHDPHYGTLHKIVIINGTKDIKDRVIASIRSHI